MWHYGPWGLPAGVCSPGVQPDRPPSHSTNSLLLHQNLPERPSAAPEIRRAPGMKALFWGCSLQCISVQGIIQSFKWNKDKDAAPFSHQRPFSLCKFCYDRLFICLMSMHMPFFCFTTTKNYCRCLLFDVSIGCVYALTDLQDFLHRFTWCQMSIFPVEVGIIFLCMSVVVCYV